MTADEEKAKVVEALQAGRVEFSDEALESLKNMAVFTGKPTDFTVTKATLESAWGPWKRTADDGTEFGNDGGFRIAWETVSAGFGELTFSLKNGVLRIDTEAMDKDFVKEVLAKLVDSAEEA